MKKLFCIILIALCINACKTYPPQAANKSAFITIGSNYDYYIREYYAVEKDNRFALKSKQDTTGAANRRLIEVEYLFVSNDGIDNVVYMTTVPDRRMNRYSTYYLSNDSVNMHDVRMLHFGKVTNTNKNELTILFEGFKKSERDTWKIQKSVNGATAKIVTITEVENNELTQVMLVDSALNNPVVFEKINPFQLVYHNHFQKNAVRATVAGNKLYYDWKKKEIIIYYDKKIDEDNVQRYEKKRIMYDPLLLFQ